ncbi:LppX_LprAFG lipoprotein [Actinomadura barringtoniae]|uniref:LppX_LprAFG lipoprotein n=1 Tax=Actinomadura barringtoniae TaxID=1427535 RepID=A0A939T684_9ACTN|nr:LppX_LprAFG lipoprotein [Actinomadura barringtoniae]MBO2450519.1 LppX_LprAFG lipoprotein [Actinomadura barringtoniae]
MTRRPYARNASAIALSAALALTMAACNDNDKTKTSARSSAPSAPATPAATTSAASSPANDKTADQILQEARAALRAERSLKISGGMVQGKETILVDLTMDGTNAQGNLTVPIKGKQVSMDIIKIDQKVYVKSTDIWKTVAPSMAARFGDRWVLSQDSLKQSFADFFTAQGWADNVLKPDGTVTREADSQVDGRRAYVLDDGTGGKLLIAADGKPLPLRLTGGGEKSSGDMTFTYDVPVNVQPPANPIVPPASAGT